MTLSRLASLLARRRSPARRGPNERGGLRRIHVGCGPKNLLADWWNVDIRPFNGVDEVIDVTNAWPWSGLDYVYGEHFLEHLDLGDAVLFLIEAGTHLRPGGVLRLSTPALEFVWATHFELGDVDDSRRVEQTYAANRAFHGWGHKFLFSRPSLERLLEGLGFAAVSFHDYGRSDDPNLRNIERHGGWHVAHGYPSTWIVEAVRGDTPPTLPTSLAEEMEQQFIRYVRSGH